MDDSDSHIKKMEEEENSTLKKGLFLMKRDGRYVEKVAVA